MVNNPNEVCLLVKHIFILSATQMVLHIAEPTACITVINAEDAKLEIMNQSLIHTKCLYPPAIKNKDKPLKRF